MTMLGLLLAIETSSTVHAIEHCACTGYMCPTASSYFISDSLQPLTILL